MNPDYPLVAERARHRCEYCGAPEAIFNFPFEVEHIVPPCHAGPESEGNWALACRSCNVFKSNHLDFTDPETQAVTRLFHPREDHWGDHFQVAAETGTIVGLTLIGRATVTLLQMNGSSQRAARLQWIRLGLFP
jgi:hypothetical protein